MEEKNNPISWFEIYVENMDRAKKFYESVFQVKLENLLSSDSEENELKMLAFPSNMTSYGAGGALVRMPGFPVGKNSVIIYFYCKDCSIEEKRVLDSGGKVEKPKFSIGQYGFISLVYDTEGNMIGLHSPV